MSLLGDVMGLTDAELVRDQDGSIAEFGRSCDLVLGWDVPTSGMLELLAAGVPVMQALFRRLGPQEWRSVDAGVVPQLMLDDLLPRLEAMRTGPMALWSFAREQASRCAERAAGAKPLRAWL
jgi:hypothetical protein